MARPVRLERTAFGSGGQRSIQLSYGRLNVQLNRISPSLFILRAEQQQQRPRLRAAAWAWGWARCGSSIGACNILARNQDDHVKNIAFLMGQRGGWALAPARRTRNRQLSRHRPARPRPRFRPTAGLPPTSATVRATPRLWRVSPPGRALAAFALHAQQVHWPRLVGRRQRLQAFHQAERPQEAKEIGELHGFTRFNALQRALGDTGLERERALREAAIQPATGKPPPQLGQDRAVAVQVVQLHLVNCGMLSQRLRTTRQV